MLAFIGFITILAIVFGVSFWDALGGFFGFVIKALVILGAIACVAIIMEKSTPAKKPTKPTSTDKR